MYNWSVDEKKFKKEDPEKFRTWTRNRRSIEKAIGLLSNNKWITGGEIYLQKPKRGMLNESPILIDVFLKKDISKYEYVSLGFVLAEETNPAISIVEQEKIKGYYTDFLLVGKFQSWFCQGS